MYDPRKPNDWSALRASGELQRGRQALEMARLEQLKAEQQMSNLMMMTGGNGSGNNNGGGGFGNMMMMNRMPAVGGNNPNNSGSGGLVGGGGAAAAGIFSAEGMFRQRLAVSAKVGVEGASTLHQEQLEGDVKMKKLAGGSKSARIKDKLGAMAALGTGGIGSATANTNIFMTPMGDGTHKITTAGTTSSSSVGGGVQQSASSILSSSTRRSAIQGKPSTVLRISGGELNRSKKWKLMEEEEAQTPQVDNANLLKERASRDVQVQCTGYGHVRNVKIVQRRNEVVRNATGEEDDDGDQVDVFVRFETVTSCLKAAEALVGQPSVFSDWIVEANNNNSDGGGGGGLVTAFYPLVAYEAGRYDATV